MKLLTPIALAIAALVTSPAFAADAAKKPVAKVECPEAATQPKPQSEKSRAEVKAAAKGASTECEASPAPKPASTKPRAEVKEETKKAVKEGTIPQGEAMETKKKP
jgi:hypothetical protein